MVPLSRARIVCSEKASCFKYICLKIKRVNREGTANNGAIRGDNFLFCSLSGPLFTIFAVVKRQISLYIVVCIAPLRTFIAFNSFGIQTHFCSKLLTCRYVILRQRSNIGNFSGTNNGREKLVYHTELTLTLPHWQCSR